MMEDPINVGQKQVIADGRNTLSAALHGDAGFPWILTAQALEARENVKY